MSNHTRQCPDEEWRDIAGYEGHYQISDTGRIRSLDRTVTYSNGKTVLHLGKLLRLERTNNGYLRVSLQKEGQVTRRLVHQLVLETFIGPRPHNLVACHNDGDRTHNTPDNLRWDTASGNQQDSVRHGTHWEVRKTHCPQGHPYHPSNIVRSTRRQRMCRECAADRTRARRQ